MYPKIERIRRDTPYPNTSWALFVSLNIRIRKGYRNEYMYPRKFSDTSGIRKDTILAGYEQRPARIWDTCILFVSQKRVGIHVSFLYPMRMLKSRIRCPSRHRIRTERIRVQDTRRGYETRIRARNTVCDHPQEESTEEASSSTSELRSGEECGWSSSSSSSEQPWNIVPSSRCCSASVSRIPYLVPRIPYQYRVYPCSYPCV